MLRRSDPKWLQRFSSPTLTVTRYLRTSSQDSSTMPVLFQSQKTGKAGYLVYVTIEVRLIQS
jgi:hypothetical protein